MASTLHALSRPTTRCLSRHTLSPALTCSLLPQRYMASLGTGVAGVSRGKTTNPSGDRAPDNSPPTAIPSERAEASRPDATKTREGSLLETSKPGTAPPPPKKPRARPTLRARSAAMTLTPAAISRIRTLLSGPNPKYIRVGVKNKGCAGMSYHLEYVDQPGKFDEKVEQDGVIVLIDSKALFSIIGSEMDWVEDRISSKFAFKNPNIKDACGCGESFNIQPSSDSTELPG